MKQLWFALVLCTGCATLAPREQARAVVLGVSEATRIADQACATVALKRSLDDKDGATELARTCAKSYDVARPALLAAAASVDTWEDGSRGHVVCSLRSAGDALVSLVATITAAGGHVPPIVDDGIKLVSYLGSCN